MSIDHRFNSTVAATGSTGIISSSDWNDTHQVQRAVHGDNIVNGFWGSPAGSAINPSNEVKESSGHISCVPYSPSQDVTINGYAMNVGFGGDSTEMQAAIYSNSTSGLKPSTLIDSSTQFDAGTTGIKTQTGKSISVNGGETVWVASRKSPTTGTASNVTGLSTIVGSGYISGTGATDPFVGDEAVAVSGISASSNDFPGTWPTPSGSSIWIEVQLKLSS